MNGHQIDISHKKISIFMFFLLTWLILIPPFLLSATPILVKDINTSGNSVRGCRYFEFNDGIYFLADDGTHGEELWRSDFPFDKAEMVKDIYPGRKSSQINVIGFLSTHIIFRASDGENERALWKSDGTPEGTTLVKAFYGPDGVTAIEKTPFKKREIRLEAKYKNSSLVYNENIFFSFKDHETISVSDHSMGSELWVSDGTTTGTHLLKDINPGPGSSFPNQLIGYKNWAFFSAFDEKSGYELWRSDGTKEGTLKVKDIFPGKIGSEPSDFFIFKDHLFFIASDNISGPELWKSDGTPDGTQLFKDINEGADGLFSDLLRKDFQFKLFNDHLFFTASDGITGNELWMSDGSALGTKQVKDIQTGGLGSDPNHFMRLGNTLYFTANDGVAGCELWRSDGSGPGTTLVKNIDGLGEDSFGILSELVVFGDALYFFADDKVNGRELWMSDGTENGTILLQDINEGSSGSRSDEQNNMLTVAGNRLYFVADDGKSGPELWKSDGTANGCQLVRDIHGGEKGGIFPKEGYRFSVIGSHIFFSANDGTHGTELWRSDGRKENTRMVGDLNKKGMGEPPLGLQNINGVFYFFANSPQTGYELWKSDGSKAGTALVKDIKPGVDGSFFKYKNSDTDDDDDRIFTSLGNTIYFAADDGVHGVELWKSDGTAEGTVLVKDIQKGELGSFQANKKPEWAVLNNEIYFTADDGIHGVELWKSNGEKDGTVLVKDMNTVGVKGSSAPNGLTVFNDKLYFGAYTDEGGEEEPNYGYMLWMSDGSFEGTIQMKYSIPNSTGEVFYLPPKDFTVLNGVLYFITEDWEYYVRRIWRTDGTVNGTLLLKEFYPGERGLNDYITASGDFIYFIGPDPKDGYELWRSDGTYEGTRMVKDICPKPLYNYSEDLESFEPSNLTDVNGTLYFTAYEDFYLKGIWKTDGSEEGTALLKKVIPRRKASYQYKFKNINGTLLFREWTKESGIELWATDGTALGTRMLFDLYKGIPGSYPCNLTQLGNTLYFTADDPTYGSELWKLDLNEIKNNKQNVSDKTETEGCFINTLMTGI